jgi:glyoxylase-like metal-dependent hydrolase (beta-lactamase superfamily II)
MGDKQDAKFFSYYYLHGNDSLAGSLSKYGFTPDDITDMVLTHLHFDHCGGSIRNEGGKLVPAFRNATYYCHQRQWDWAVNPNAREKASFLKENILPIRESGRLTFIDDTTELIPGLNFIEVNGHTEAMLLPKVTWNGQTLLYMADLIPSAGHLPLPYVMAYDVRPLDTLKEKERILNDAANGDWKLFFEHDPSVECVSLERTEKGIRKKDTLALADFT